MEENNQENQLERISNELNQLGNELQNKLKHFINEIDEYKTNYYIERFVPLKKKKLNNEKKN